MPSCSYCGAVTAHKCTGCSDTFYCSRDCQKATWKSHKLVCASRLQGAPAASVDTAARDDEKLPTSTQPKPAAAKPIKTPVSKPKKASRRSDEEFASGISPNILFAAMSNAAKARARGSTTCEGVRVPQAGDRDYYGPIGCTMRTGVCAVARNRSCRSAQAQM
jgi:MYND finger